MVVGVFGVVCAMWDRVVFDHLCNLQIVVLAFLLSILVFSPLFHKVEQSRCVYPQ